MKNIEATIPQKRPRGRPRAFDRGEALFAAGETFRRLGYEGASVNDLTEAMGITPQSLYGAFNSKADLYREAVSYNLQTDGAISAQILNQPGSVADAIEKLLLTGAQTFTTPGRPKGCMVSTAVLTCAVENREIADHMARLRANMIAAVRMRFAAAVESGDLRPDTDTAALARFIGAIMQGMSVQALDGASEAELASIAAHACAEVRRHQA